MKGVMFLLSALILPFVSTGKNHMTNHSLEFEVRPSYVIPTNSFLKEPSTDVKSAVSPHLRYSFQFSPESRYGQLYPTAYQGIGIGYLSTFPSKSLGNPVSVYLFQGLRLASFSPKLWLDYEWNFGISAGWKEYDEVKNPTNGAIGSDVNAYLNLGVVLNYRINSNFKMVFGIAGTHYSDGNSKLPNAGVNLVGGKLGLVYTIGGRQEWSPVRDYDFEHGLSYDLTVYGAPRQRLLDVDGNQEFLDYVFGVAGINFAPMYSFHPYLRAGVSLDMQYDESVSLKKNLVSGSYPHLFYRQPFRERFSAGLSLHAELMMPVFSINFGIGRNIIANSVDTRIFYQTLALKIYVLKNAYLNIGYQLRDFHEPNNLMLGVGYSFGLKR